MSTPASLYGNEFIEGLRSLRDQALVESHYYGRRKKIGKFSVGVVRAWWATEDDDGTAYLTDQGLRYGEEHIMPSGTNLTVYNYEHIDRDGKMPVVEYQIDLGIGSIEVYGTILPRMNIRSLAKWNFAKRQERKFNLQTASDEDRGLLYTEMERGASGLFAITSSSEEELDDNGET